MKHRNLAIVAWVAAGLLVTGTSLRAQQPGMGMRDMPMGLGMMRPGMMGMMRMMGDCMMVGMMMGGDTSTFADGRIAFLKAELAITDTQKGAWESYAAALRKNLQGMQAMHQAMVNVMEAKTPVERLEGHINVMDGRLASLKELKPALAALYGALSEDQKKKADQVLTGMGCMM
ncbi:MAG TPA: Spy/CpxP family protein refolding chaperone [Hyphomicrobiaceae bacterium]|nr:Spy/CpxP family protein refolding chaperone [Hyphomicrobiaceae bacterium]